MKKYLATALLILSPCLAQAVEVPRSGNFDHRVRFVNYEPSQVVKVIAHYGYQTHIQFAEDETVETPLFGDELAWKFRKIRNHLFLLPVEDEADTNLTVVTNKRVYNIELLAKEAKDIRAQDLFFQVNYRYPTEEAAKRQAVLDAAKVDAKLSVRPEPVNWNYWGKGTQQVSPTEVWDDGTFTYLRFPNNRDIPAIFLVDEAGNEGRVNSTVDPNEPGLVIVERVARQLVLRKGEMVSCVINESFDSYGTTNATGTSIPGVERVIRVN